MRVRKRTVALRLITFSAHLNVALYRCTLLYSQGPAEILFPSPISANFQEFATHGAGNDAGTAVLFAPSSNSSAGFGPALAIGTGNHFTSAGMSVTAAGALAAGTSGYIDTIPKGWTLSVNVAARPV